MNTLYYGDNLPILRRLPSESVDLIYLDPPFNSARSYNVLFKNQHSSGSDAQMPPETGTFLAAQKVKKSQGEQSSFLG